MSGPIGGCEISWKNEIDMVITEEARKLSNPMKTFVASAKLLPAPYYWFVTAKPELN